MKPRRVIQYGPIPQNWKASAWRALLDYWAKLPDLPKPTAPSQEVMYLERMSGTDLIAFQRSERIARGVQKPAFRPECVLE